MIHSSFSRSNSCRRGRIVSLEDAVILWNKVWRARFDFGPENAKQSVGLSTNSWTRVIESIKRLQDLMAVAFREAGGVTTRKVLFCESLSEFLLVARVFCARGNRCQRMTCRPKTRSCLGYDVTHSWSSSNTRALLVSSWLRMCFDGCWCSVGRSQPMHGYSSGMIVEHAPNSSSTWRMELKHSIRPASQWGLSIRSKATCAFIQVRSTAMLQKKLVYMWWYKHKTDCFVE